MAKTQTFKDRLVMLMNGDRPYTWSKKVGIEKGLFQYYWQKGKIPTYENLLKIQRFSGCSLDWLLTGEMPTLGGVVAQIPRAGFAGKDGGARQRRTVAALCTMTDVCAYCPDEQLAALELMMKMMLGKGIAQPRRNVKASSPAAGEARQ